MPRAVSYSIERAANSSVMLSASIPATRPCSAIGRPPASRVFANSVISATRRSAAPTQRAATIIRSKRNHSRAYDMPSPSPPTRLAAGTRTPAKPTIGWWWLIVCE